MTTAPADAIVPMATTTGSGVSRSEPPVLGASFVEDEFWGLSLALASDGNMRGV
jgi:hypothetical protein